jgi:transcriptional regulator with XRE-family HTH domain
MERGMTMGELAEASGLSLSHLTHIENGRSVLGLTTLGRLAAALGMPPVWFVIFPDENMQDRVMDELRKLPLDKLRELQRQFLGPRS